MQAKKRVSAARDRQVFHPCHNDTSTATWHAVQQRSRAFAVSLHGSLVRSFPSKVGAN